MSKIFFKDKVVLDLNTHAFLNLLFDEGQVSCFTENPHGYKVSHSPRSDDLFFCINALHPSKDLNPTKEWHDEHKPRRADVNVVCYRNFLIEIDNMPLEEQIQYVTSKVPVSTIVYSGGRSYHFIISLETPLASATEYAEVARRLCKLFPEADRTMKNPSRLSRLPSRIRPETNKKQELHHLGKRVPNKQLLDNLPEIPKIESKQVTAEEAKIFLSPLIIEACMIPDEVMNNRGIQGRNAFFFWLGHRMDDVNMEPSKKQKYIMMAYNNLKNTKDFPLEEALQAARVEWLKN